ncbi:hypothetical protein QZH41_011661 [Actinostola sp. cb2023]|nr:hypothetical protein QZH41_011661 [Actinostola sp. cb2023]
MARRSGSVLVASILVVLSLCSQGWSLLPGEKELLTFQRSHSLNNTMSDLIFLVDVSGSLRHYIYQNGRLVIKNGFDDEKVFVNSLLNHIRVSLPSTRVSIILFGTKATIDINYISNLSPDNHKCNFKQAFNSLRFRSGMTNMKQAFQLADKIIFGGLSGSKRPTALVKTAIFLLTDGNWNEDGSPYPVARALRDKGIEIFAIGVTSGIDYGVLNQIASAGRGIRYSGFNQFREMANYLRGDPYEKDWITQPRSKCGASSCDLLAKCACGLLSGEYKCACPKGYYGSGYIGDCKPCPVSTYKPFAGHAKSCYECPEFSSHTQQRSFRKSDCKCNTGYDGDPGSNTPCRIKQCDQFPVPDHGEIRGGTCNTDYLSTCEMACKEGYELLRSGRRTCNLDSNGNAKWSGVDPSCKEITCLSLKIPHASPESGICQPHGLLYKTKCTIKCATGYILRGSDVRICQLDKTWSGETVCEEVRCPKLNSIPLTQVKPPECVQRDMRFYSTCSFTCPMGYAMSGKSVQGLVRYCGVNGQWDDQSRTCVDVTQPTIKCPDSIMTSTSLRLPHALLTWSDPVYEDNSIGADPLAELTVTSKFTSPHAFKIGRTKVSYTVRDNAKLEASCFFDVVVQDKEAPEMTSCPEDQHYELVGKSSMLVRWDKPTFTDNSGLPPSIETDIRPGTRLGLGEHMIHYIAKDNAQNANYSCEFKITIKAKTCPVTKPPRNGALACNAFGSSNSYCQVSCSNNYDFAFPPAGMYLCARGVWNAFPFGAPFPWPDCSVRYDPNKVKVQFNTAFYYYEGDCNSEDAQKQIKGNFIKLLQTGILIAFGQTCFNVAECNTDNVNVYCGKTDASKRRRRAVVKEVYIKLNLVAKEKPSIPKTIKELESALESKSRPVVDAEVQKTDWSPLRVSDGLDFKSYSLSHADAYCSDQGAVVGKCDSLETGCDGKTKPQSKCSCNSASGSIEKCIRCPEGTYYNTLKDKCFNCKPGTFQNKEGRFECHQCPEGTWTLGQEAKNFTACREKCKPGYFSPSGLAKCFPCPRGAFASGYMNNQCTACPLGTTTLLATSTGREDCGMKCAPGTFSSSGVEPCKPCPKGTYQDVIGSMSCKDCDGVLSTFGPGADSKSMCIDIDDCASNPCNNGGRCIDHKDGYRCECLLGYMGKQCEIEKDECLSDPCYQGSTCVDKCEIEKDECLSDPCYQGSTCVDKCEIEKDECLSDPCYQGSTCVDKCEIEKDECLSDPCYQGSTCVDKCEIEKDECLSDPCYQGSTCVDKCEIEKDECLSDPCYQGSTCVDKCEIEKDECLSDPCYQGSTCVDKCEIEKDECLSDPCYQGSTCVDKCEIEKDECLSDPCYQGSTCVDKCEIEKDECLSDPCYQGSTCVDKCEIEKDECLSDPCYQGSTCVDKCEIEKDECLSDPCYQGSTCVDKCEIEKDECLSDPCYQGSTCVDKCEIEKDECLSDPCYQGSTCVDKCEIEKDECLSDPCYQGSTCVDKCEIEKDECLSDPCYQGSTCVDKCEIEKDECLSDPCYQGSTCVDKCEIEKDECLSDPCYQGSTCVDKCEIEKDECLSDPCYQGSTCVDKCEIEKDECLSDPCYQGSTCVDKCEIEKDECLSDPCYQGSTCVDKCEIEKDECLSDPCYQGSTCVDKCEIEKDECLSDPCYQGSTCVDKCEIEKDECLSDPCYQGSTCVDKCEIEKDECLSDPCYQGSTCVDKCEIEKDECLSDPCYQGSTCVDKCEIEKDECLSDPCYQGSTCVDKCEIEKDECLSDPCYQGSTCVDKCEIEKDECLSDPCYQGSTCVDKCEIEKDECLSDPCYQGSTCVDKCEIEKDECLSDPCYQGSTCVDKCEIEKDECLSDPCYQGSTCVDKCEIEKDECLSDPCYQGSTCVDKCEIEKDECLSDPCYQGSTCVDKCEIEKDECLSDPCYQGSTCVDKCEIEKDECLSDPCYQGSTCVDKCEIEKDECLSDPCYQGSTCVDKCEIEKDECLSDPCYQGSTCVDKCEIEKDECLSDPCYQGSTCVDKCEIEKDECLSDPCYQGSTCVDKCEIEKDECLSDPCYQGSTCVDKCEIEKDECLSDPCYQGSTCVDKCEIEKDECLSDPCYQGSTCVDKCEIEKDECLSDPCYQGSTCVDKCEIEKDECLSDPCYQGSTCVDKCEIEKDECLSDPCYQGSTCVDKCEIEKDECLSDPCYQGSTCVDKCEIEKDECLSDPCYQGSTCVDKCEIEKDECLSDPCYQGSTCVDKCEIEKDECLSDPCYQGSTCVDKCEIEKDECLSDPCYQGSTCVDKCEIEKDECLSDPCYQGSTCVDKCEIEKDECLSDPCYQGSTCVDKCEIEKDECLSDPCYQGSTCVDKCEIEKDECLSDPCYQGSTCVDKCEIEKDECLSDPCYQGSTCVDKCEIEKDECLSDPCYQGSTCVDKCEIEKDECLSDPCYQGSTCVDKCEIEKDECLSDPCYQGSTCVDKCEIEKDECLSDPCYQGSTCVDKCEIEKDECLSDPCYQGSTCVDKCEIEKDECLSDPCYQGSTCVDKCEIEKDECLSDPCYQGSTCVDKVNGYECVCSHGYKGKNCDVAVGLCSPNPCQNGAKCLPQPPKALCECPKGYGGQFCEMKLDLCASTPCLNGGLCKSLVDSFQCICRHGYSGSQCELRADDCSSNPCVNGGVCTNEVNGYRCSCHVGFTGSQCEKNVVNCYPNPCNDNGACVERGNGYECLCRPNYAGKTCQTKVSPDYDVTFPLRVATSSSSVTNIPDLRAFTIAFWLRTADSENPGTPISYATTVQGKVMDNALVLQDYGAFTLHINNEKHFIGISANDGHWHHVAVTWRNSDGQWVFYLDGESAKSSSAGLQVNAVIKGGGVLVLGQEQDTLGDGFSPEEAFTGDISQMNLWDRVLSANEVANLVYSCQASEGNVKAWGDFVAGLQGVFVRTTRSHACDFNSKLRSYQFTYESRYPSQDHKVLTSKTAEQCAVACESEPSFPCRSFDYDRAKKKCYLSKAVAGNGDLIPAKGFEFYQTDCLDSFGMEAKAIPDSSLSASSSMDTTSAPKEARLHNSRVSGVTGMSDSRGGWSPSVNNNQQYLQVDLGRLLKVTGVATQGADSSSEWVTSFKLEHSSDGSQWHYYPSTLPGNRDDSTVVRHQVQVFSARFVRLRPQAWHGRIALRADIYGCDRVLDVSIRSEGCEDPVKLEGGCGRAYITVDCTEYSPKQRGFNIVVLDGASGRWSTRCPTNHCVNGGTCVQLVHGYRCLCVPGYQGDTCQTESLCSNPGTPPNGRRSSSSFTHGSTVTFTCNAGYRLQGSSSRTCTRGQWSGTAPRCIDMDECAQGLCGQLCTNSDGSYKCACQKGYQLNADGRKCDDINECTISGVCSHSCHNSAGGFRCTCPAGMQISNGGRSCKDMDECSTNNNGCEHVCANAYLSYVCHCRGGYYRESNRRQCSEKRCPSTSTPANGQQSIHGDRILGNVLTITCSPGHKLIGCSSRTCQADGKWSGTEPRCDVIYLSFPAVRCPAIGTIKNGQVGVTAGQSYNSKATFSCNAGFDLVGMVTRTCQQNGQWSDVQPRCVRADCPSLSAPAHGKIEGIRREVGSTVRVSCSIGYRVTPDNGAFRTCGSDKKWSGSDPTCQIIDCGDPGTPWHGFKDGSDYRYSAAVTYRCRAKHFLEGVKERKCGADGKWTGSLPRCLENSCGNPGSPSNGVKTGNNHTYGAVIRYSCNKGYDLRGSSSRTCQTTGQWNGVQPTCNIKNCGDPGSPSNGHRVGNDFTYGNAASFDCSPGYKLHGSASRVCRETGTWSGTKASCVVSNCGKIVYGPTGTIQSTNFPNNYPSNEYCTWEIRVPQGKQVRIDFQEFRTEANKDVVLVYDTGKTEPMIAFSGIKDKPRALTSSGNSLRVRFISDGVHGNNGFKLTYKQTDCGGMLTARSGEIRSPGFPSGYPALLSCTWLIRMRNTKIALQLPEFNTENAYDRLEVAHGPWVTAPLEISWSGPRPLYGDVKTQNYMWLHFYTNSKNDRFYKGFRATYKPYDPYAKRK